MVLLLAVQRRQHIDVTLVGAGRGQVHHQAGRYLLSIYNVPDTVLGSRDTALNRRDNSPFPHGDFTLVALLALTTLVYLEMG